MAGLVSIGNSRTVCATLLDDGRIADVRRVPTGRIDAASVGPPRGPIHLIGVVADRALAVVTALRASGRTVVWWGAERPIPVGHPYAAPAAPGSDRLVAALAAFRRVRGACIVVDAGTALTVDLVGAGGEFLGGAIAPGFGTLAAGLHARAPALPAAAPSPPPEFPASSTEGAVQLGVHAAFRGALRELVAAARGASGGATVVVTGGDADLTAGALARWTPAVVPELVLEGLAHLATLR